MYTTDKRIKNKGVILNILKVNPSIVYFIDLEIYEDKNFILECMEIYPKIYKFVSSKLKKDKDILLKLVNKDSMLLHLVDKKYIDHEIMKESLLQNPKSFYYFRETNNMDIIKEALLKYPYNYSILSSFHKNSVSIAKLVAKDLIFTYFPKLIQTNESFVLTYVSNFSSFLYIKFIIEKFPENREIILKALKNPYGFGKFWKDIPEEFQNDTEIYCAFHKLYFTLLDPRMTFFYNISIDFK